jgi:hypothetical protein
MAVFLLIQAKKSMGKKKKMKKHYYVLGLLLILLWPYHMLVPSQYIPRSVSTICVLVRIVN